MAHERNQARVGRAASRQCSLAEAGPGALRAMWERGESAVMGWLHLPSSISVEIMASLGFDMLAIDMQHGPITHDDALMMLPAVLSKKCTPIVRVQSRESELIGPLLDAGALGIIAPQINTRAQAEEFVAACRYPPVGHRSFGPLRIGLHVDDYFANANDTVLTFALIESIDAIDNLDEIVSTPGLDGVILGPVDLCIDARGELPTEYDSDLRQWARQIATAGKAHGIAVALIAIVDSDLDFLFQLKPEILMLGSDFELLATGARHRLDMAFQRLSMAGLRTATEHGHATGPPLSAVGEQDVVS